MEKQVYIILGILSSISLDWSRRFIGLNLNFFIFNSFPIPIYDESSKFSKRLVELTGLLSCVYNRLKMGKTIFTVLEVTKENNIYGLTEDQLIQTF